MSRFFRQAALWFGAVLLIAGCATSPPEPPKPWLDPGYTGQGFRKYLVVGLSSRDLSDQRDFENRMVAKLIDTGVLAEPGYKYLKATKSPDQATILAAISKSGADAVLLARISEFKTKTEVVPGAPVAVYESVTPVDSVVYGSAGMYNNWYAVTPTADYQSATIYTTLFDVQTAKPVWVLNVPDFDPATVKQDVPNYINMVVENLLKARLLRP
jgi:hypothetical protein